MIVRGKLLSYVVCQRMILGTYVNPFMATRTSQTDNGTYAYRVMAADASEIMWSLTGYDSLAADISVMRSGPFLVSD